MERRARIHMRMADTDEITGESSPGTDETGSWFPVPDESGLPSDLRGLFAKARGRLGFVPNVFRVYAFRLYEGGPGVSTMSAC